MRGKCQIQLSSDDKEKLVKQSIPDEEDEEDEAISHEVDDSDDDDITTEVATVFKEPEPVKKKITKKKIVKKSE